MSDSMAIDREGTKAAAPSEEPEPRRPADQGVRYPDLEGAFSGELEPVDAKSDREILARRMAELERRLRELEDQTSAGDGSDRDAASGHQIAADVSTELSEVLGDEFEDGQFSIECRVEQERVLVRGLVDAQISLFEWSDRAREIERWANEHVTEDNPYSVEVAVQMT